MKIKSIVTSIFLTSALSVSAVTFSGQAVTNITGAVAGSSSYVIVDTNNDGLAFDGSVAGDTFTLNSFVGTSDDYVIGYNASTSTFAVTTFLVRLVSLLIPMAYRLTMLSILLPLVLRQLRVLLRLQV